MSDARPGYFQFAATDLNGNGRIKQIPSYSRNCGCTGASTACQCLTRASFIYPQFYGMPVQNFHKTGIDPFREPFMIFDQRAFFQYGCPIEIIDELNGVGIAHRDYRYGDGFPDSARVQYQIPDRFGTDFITDQSFRQKRDS